MIDLREEKKRFAGIHSWEPNLECPQKYSEKLIYKKLHNRNPLIPHTSDKYRAREYIREKIGPEAEYHLVPLIWAGKEPKDIPFDSLPSEYIIKPNHAGGWWIIKDRHYIVEQNEPCDTLTREQIIEICDGWLSKDFSLVNNEWGFRDIDRLIVVEKLLKTKDGNIPFDYKFCMFGGKCRMLYVGSNRFDGLGLTYYDERWCKLDINLGGKPNPDMKKPTNKEFNTMIRFAEKLAEPFDFVRIDFFLVDDRVYFSEITHTPGAGYPKFPLDMEIRLGSYWELDY